MATEPQVADLAGGGATLHPAEAQVLATTAAVSEVCPPAPADAGERPPALLPQTGPSTAGGDAVAETAAATPAPLAEPGVSDAVAGAAAPPASLADAADAPAAIATATAAPPAAPAPAPAPAPLPPSPSAPGPSGQETLVEAKAEAEGEGEAEAKAPCLPPPLPSEAETSPSTLPPLLVSAAQEGGGCSSTAPAVADSTTIAPTSDAAAPAAPPAAAPSAPSAAAPEEVVSSQDVMNVPPTAGFVAAATTRLPPLRSESPVSSTPPTSPTEGSRQLSKTFPQVAGEGPRDSLSSVSSDVPAAKTQTLSSQDPEMAARVSAYQRRTAKLKEKRKAKAPSSEHFLSNLQEIEADVDYRFNFNIVGNKSTDVVNSALAAPEARRLTGSGPTPSSAGGYRCLCEVMVPIPTDKEKGDRGIMARKVANLSMRALSFDQDIPLYETRQESMSAAIVYVLWIDGHAADGASDFQEQLQGMTSAIENYRGRSKARKRPVKAVLLVYENPESGAPKSGLETWALNLTDWEHRHGELWKFGPLCMEDLDALHGTFAEMTSSRLKHAQNDKEDDLPPDDGKEDFTFKPSAGQLASKPGQGASPSDAGSSCSEQELPPAFEAEASGSECSESAMELHRAVFGLTKDQGADETTVASLGGTHRTEGIEAS